ncbi:hypothetical protein FGF1_28920 [Flavobacteriaceae bacterium GF1]
METVVVLTPGEGRCVTILPKTIEPEGRHTFEKKIWPILDSIHYRYHLSWIGTWPWVP